MYRSFPVRYGQCYQIIKENEISSANEPPTSFPDRMILWLFVLIESVCFVLVGMGGSGVKTIV